MACTRDEKNLFAEERRQTIVDTVTRDSRATVSDLAERFGVSTATLRNDLRDLEASGLLRRTHGGAVALEVVAHEHSADVALGEHSGAKASIGAAAAGFVHDGDTIFCDSGPTTLELVKALPALSNITLITNDFKIALAAEMGLADPTIIVLGGTVRNGFHYAMDSSTIDTVSLLSATTSFIAASAFSFDRGFSVHTLELANYKRKMIARSEKRIALLDSSKMGSFTTATFAQLTDFDVFVTDGDMAQRDRERIKQSAPNLDLRIAEDF